MADVILVDKKDHEIGNKEKMQTHIDGDLHRAFSIQLYNSNGEVFIHQRALTKYHCGGVWTNACCSHPFPGELTIDGAIRRLYEELGYKQIQLKEEFVFQYKKEFDNGLIENEIDHVFIGYTDLLPPQIDPEEIGDYKWISVDKLKYDIQENQVNYSVWFKKIMNHLHE